MIGPLLKPFSFSYFNVMYNDHAPRKRSISATVDHLSGSNDRHLQTSSRSWIKLFVIPYPMIGERSPSTILNAFIVRYLSEYAIGHIVSSDWTELYRPKCLDDIVGNPKAVEDLRRWADSWDAGKPSKKAAVLIGTPGTGKTSAALALGKDRDWNVVEMNASDQRNADSIACVATRGAMGDTFTEDGRYLSKKEGHLKLIILDEADNISGQEDKGGITAIVDLVRTTKQPIILIVNDYYALTKKSAVLKTQTEQIKFSRLKPVTVRGVLRKIAKDQNCQDIGPCA